MATEEKKNAAAHEPVEDLENTTDAEAGVEENAAVEAVAEETTEAPSEDAAAEADEEDVEAPATDEAPAEVDPKKAPPEAPKAEKAEAPEAPVDEKAEEKTEEKEEDKLPMKWYVIHTYSGHENKVKENILKMVKTSNIGREFGRLIVPTEEVAEMKKGKKTVTTRKFFPSYILIEMFISDESWHLVNAIPGVTSFVGSGAKPQPLSEAEVERILGRMDKERDTIIPEIPFTLGEHIRIKDGPFSDFTGVIDEINAEKGKLRVLVSIFGRETPVELDFLQVEPV
jgi:transcriptional antiterminator NusG